jgi:hypothetical protein
MSLLFHVTSALNRESIRAHGLDWSRMGPACGIAGSRRPEEQGVFLCSDDHEAGYFVDMNNTGGPVDVWAVEGVTEDELVQSGNGYWYLPRRIPPETLSLVSASVQSDGWERRTSDSGPTNAYQSRLTLTLDDGTVLRDAEAHEFIRRAHHAPESAE